MIIKVINNNTLILDDFKFKCCVGKYGITKNKQEGDKKTPKGNFKLGNLYFRKDRHPKPDTKLKVIPIKNIQNPSVIKGGGHFMVYNMANEVSQIINKSL